MHNLWTNMWTPPRSSRKLSAGRTVTLDRTCRHRVHPGKSRAKVGQKSGVEMRDVVEENWENPVDQTAQRSLVTPGIPSQDGRTLGTHRAPQDLATVWHDLVED